MNLHSISGRAMTALAGATLALALAAIVPSAAGALETRSAVIAQNGFGDRHNSYSWSMGWFQGKLYVGTGRDVLCVENETLQYFVPLLSTYLTNPSPGVRCPSNPYRMDLRAEIWQYAPAGQHWKMVYRAPTEPNPLAAGYKVASDIAYRGMTVYKERHGREALYAAGVSADEYLPPLLESNPPRIMRSYDGVHWRPLDLGGVVVHYPGGNKRPMGFRSLLSWRGRLFVTATPDLTGDGAVFEVRHAGSAHPKLVQITPTNLDVFEIAKFRGDLYVGCGSASEGYSVWRTSGHGHPFEPVITGGAGRGSLITSVVSMKVFRDALYVGSSGWYNRGTLPLSELVRIRANGNWTLVVGKPRKLPDGAQMYPTSGLGDGFGSLFNAHFWRMASQGGGLYVGTNSWSDVLKSYSQTAWLGDLLADASGFQMWASCNGDDFFPLTRDAFGTGEYNFGARTLQPGGPHDEELYIGSANHAQGTTIIDDREPACSSLINKPHQLATPAAMVSERVHGGTLLSWRPSADAARYRVLAASQLTVPLYLKAPPTLPSGFQMEGAEPTVVAPESPGSVPVQLTLPGSFEPVETTTDSFFLAHSSGTKVYTVVAESASGERSTPSNIQIDPAPEPAPSFASLWRALAPSGTRASAARATGAQELVASAQAAWSRGARSTAVGDLARLASRGGEDDQLAALAQRLERRLRYEAAARVG
jgi:hypothetical protein